MELCSGAEIRSQKETKRSARMEAGEAISRSEEKKESSPTMEEHWSGLQKAVDSWRDNLVRTVCHVAGMAGAGAQGIPQQGRRRHGRPVLFANISSKVARFGDSAENVAGESSSPVTYLPKPGTYAYDKLQRHFKDLDQDGAGFISEADLRIALTRLNLPASENDIQVFLDQIVDTTTQTQTTGVTFEQFADYAVQRENELVDTFGELDKRKIGYITEDALKTALRKYKFRLKDEEVAERVEKMHVRGGATQFYSQSIAFDFAGYRDFLMFSTSKDLQDNNSGIGGLAGLSRIWTWLQQFQPWKQGSKTG